VNGVPNTVCFKLFVSRLFFLGSERPSARLTCPLCANRRRYSIASSARASIEAKTSNSVAMRFPVDHQVEGLLK
jgi:hypothetical protein